MRRCASRSARAGTCSWPSSCRRTKSGAGGRRSRSTGSTSSSGSTCPDRVDAETSSEDAERSKPHPDIFEAALAWLEGIEAADATAVDDIPYDAWAAEKVGLRTIGLLCGGWPEREFRRAGGVAIYRDPADLLRHDDQSPLRS
jgi:Haloacid dehalogenase-like hydrolase